MPPTSRSYQNDDNDESRPAVSLLHSIVGRSSFSQGRAILMVECVSISTTFAIALGLFGAAGPFNFLGRGAAFSLFSSIGYSLGAAWHYSSTASAAFAALLDFPELIRFHLLSNFPALAYRIKDAEGWTRYRREAFGPDARLSNSPAPFSQLFNGNSQYKSQVIAAFYSLQRRRLSRYAKDGNEM